MGGGFRHAVLHVPAARSFTISCAAQDSLTLPLAEGCTLCDASPMQDLIGTVEACQILGIDRSTLSRWVNHRNPKILPAMQLPGDGRMLFDRADVEALRQPQEQSA